MQKPTNVLVTGANGQLGLTLKDISYGLKDINWIFLSSSELDITNREAINKFFYTHKIDYCVNCAAYTNVEKAEDEIDKAFAVNYDGVKNIVDSIKETGTILIHISTDYVFDGKKKTPYTEEDKTNPINVYGRSKLAGEEYIQHNIDKFYIIRTSWLYSKYRKNFYTTVKNRIEAGQELTITESQKGAPTSAKDLASAIVHIINRNSNSFGIYHFCNSGTTNWFQFAKKIIKLRGYNSLSKLIKTGEYKTKAKRPENSKLNTLKFEKTFNYGIPDWEESLKDVEA